MPRNKHSQGTKGLTVKTLKMHRKKLNKTQQNGRKSPVRELENQ